MVKRVAIVYLGVAPVAKSGMQGDPIWRSLS